MPPILPDCSSGEHRSSYGLTSEHCHLDASRRHVGSVRVDPPEDVGPTVPLRAPTGAVDAAGLRAAGWAVPPPPDGMVAYDAVTTGVGQDAVLHLAYTDGIATLSLFEQHGRLNSSALPGWRRSRLAGTRVRVSGGYPTRTVWSAGDHVYTVVTQCDERTVEALVRSLPAGHGPDGLSPRVSRGLRRVASWINPAR